MPKATGNPIATTAAKENMTMTTILPAGGGEKVESVELYDRGVVVDSEMLSSEFLVGAEAGDSVGD